MSKPIPRVSVIMPVYNSAKYLKQALTSVLQETYIDFELLICNDGSTDNSQKIIDRFAQKDTRIKTYIRKTNSGKVSKVYQFLANKAKGEYLAPTDSDDICLPHRLKTLISAADKNPDAVVVYGQTRVINPQHKTLYFYGKKYDPYEIFIANYVPDGSLLIRRDIFKKIGGYAPNITWAEDYELRLRLGLERRFVYVAKEVYIYRLHNANQTATKFNYQETVSFRYKLYQQCLEQIKDIGHTPVNYRTMICLRYISAWHALTGNNLKSAQYRIILEKLLKKDILTKENLSDKLLELGLKPGQNIIVHSALSSFGVIAGGAETVVNVLKNIITDNGLIIMPAFTYQTQLAKTATTINKKHCFTLDMPAVPDVGIIAEYFRKSSAVVRTFHPYLSFSLWGKNSKDLVKKYHMHDSLTSKSPLSEIINNNGYVLLLGADFSAISILHLAEYLANVPYKEFSGRFGYIEKKQKKIIALRKTGHSGEFKKIAGALFIEGRQFYKNIKIGDADCYLIQAKYLVNTAINILKIKPDFFLCPDPACQACAERKKYFN